MGRENEEGTVAAGRGGAPGHGEEETVASAHGEEETVAGSHRADGADDGASQRSSLLQGFDDAVEPQTDVFGPIRILSPFVERHRDEEDSS